MIEMKKAIKRACAVLLAAIMFLESADVTNLEDLGADDTDASVSMLVWNNGLQPVNKVTAYAKKPDGYMSDAYPNMRVKILMDGETLNDAQPQVDDLAVRTVPSWYIDPNHVKPDPESTVQTGTEATDPATTDPAAAGPAATDSPGTDSVATNPAAAKSI